jgi:hypothetical protein
MAAGVMKASVLSVAELIRKGYQDEGVHAHIGEESHISEARCGAPEFAVA